MEKCVPVMAKPISDIARELFFTIFINTPEYGVSSPPPPTPPVPRELFRQIRGEAPFTRESRRPFVNEEMTIVLFSKGTTTVATGVFYRRKLMNSPLIYRRGQPLPHFTAFLLAITVHPSRSRYRISSTVYFS